ncbi:MAG: glutathione peroxidase [Halobacteriovoraceae bacterium]|nr:glutathione peroxidase [Halobacteriovoraceae bacterium]|tara:strand:+ start:652 stop:1185 length:534 start_codon:yes stop_codon:yes gene_type:complete
MKNLVILLFLILSSLAFVEASDFYSIQDKTFNGKDFQTKDLKGKVTLVVNIASRCGYTPQLNGLQELYEKYKNKNFTIIGVPSNDFGGQSPESNSEFKKFCEFNYGVKFPILKKSKIKGPQKTKLYNYLTNNAPTKGEVRWNFEKFLVDKNGIITNRFNSSVTPSSEVLLKSIKKNL